MNTFLSIIHVLVCVFLVLFILVQQGKGGGMGAALGGGGGAAQVFGGRGAGNFLTRGTGICAVIFFTTSVSLAYLSSSGDHALKDRQAAENKKRDDRGFARGKDSAPTPASAAPSAPAPAPSN
ncbi:MAG: preprotein translocase subunit SecG [Myxococcales bacterium]|nr:preprotein translocase subunit SecG [Myxococcales bacterium]HQY62392.1 preprotein translocase subunit SecG [Polyangiaceae bacterium]